MIELEGLSPWLFAVAPLVVIAGYTVFGLTGFGATAITVPILAQFLPISFLVPLMVLLDMASAAFVGTKGREHVAKQELKPLVPFMLVGFVAGATILAGTPDRSLRVALGLFALGLGVYSIVNPTVHVIVSRWWCVPLGLVGGVIATIFGAAGPMYATYFSARGLDKNEIRSTVSTVILVSAIVRAFVYAFAGLLLHLSVFIAMVALSPFAWIGITIGRRIHTGLTQMQMRRLVGAILVFTGASLLVRVFI